MYNDMMGMGEKNPKIYIQERKQGKNSPFGFPPIPPLLYYKCSFICVVHFFVLEIVERLSKFCF